MMPWESGCSSNMRDFNAPIFDEGRTMGDLQGILDGVLCMKVMTDDQIEILRRQISIYATICEQLVVMHRTFASHQETLAGLKFGNMLYNPSAEAPKFAARQRWIPTTMQLQILEDIFKQGYGTPNKQKIAEITSELAKHGHVSEVKVYNWFQNKRARAKKKQAAHRKSIAEPESEAEIDSSSMKKIKMDEIHEYDLDLLQLEPNRSEEDHDSNEIARALCTQEQMPFYETVASHPSMWSNSFRRV